jgi:flagellar biosynthesis protein FlhA
MAETAGSGRAFRSGDLLLGGGVIGILTVLIVPLPALLLDFLLSTNLTLSLLVLLVAMCVRRPLDFSVFPSLLLVATLYRLSLNVAATRLILLHGGEGPAAAGRVIQGFGQFMLGGNFVVGLVLFLILVVIQFVVITKGAGRVAEVAARFTLDAMPGKQMAIDADLNAGLINEREARERRTEIAREADFYGAMDGASKFVRGDAVAALVITAINILGGLLVGIFQEGLAPADAVATYTVLTVGDGLVAQLPALVTSTAAGIVVTRAATESDLSRDLLGQLTQRARPLGVAAGVLAILALVPGLPALPFLVPAAVLGLLVYRLGRRAGEAAATQTAAAPPPGPESVDGLLAVDPLQVEIGYGLLPVVEQPGAAGGGLLERIRLIRRQFAQELGFVVPPIRLRDSALLGGHQYAFRLRGTEVARGDVYPERLLAMNPGGVLEEIEGIEVREPTFGLPARWIARSRREAAVTAGYTVVDPATVIATHLSETIRRHAATLLGRQEAQGLVEQLRATHPAVVEGLIPALLPLGVVHRVLQRLLAEGVAVRDLPGILEVLADLAPATRDPVVLAEHARAALADHVCRPYLGVDGGLKVLLLGPATENQLSAEVARAEGDEGLSPALAQALLQAVSRALAQAQGLDAKPVLLCPGPLRRHVRRVTERSLPHLGVIAYAEVSPHVAIRAIGTVELEHAPQAV